MSERLGVALDDSNRTVSALSGDVDHTRAALQREHGTIQQLLT